MIIRYPIWISTFLVELNLDDVLEVLRVVGSEIYKNVTWRYQRKVKRIKDNMILKLYFDLPCRTSPWWCSRGSPGGWIKITNFVDKYHRKMH